MKSQIKRKNDGVIEKIKRLLGLRTPSPTKKIVVEPTEEIVDVVEPIKKPTPEEENFFDIIRYHKEYKIENICM